MIPERIFYRIGDVAEIVGVKPHVIRFWETEFPFLTPDKASSGQRVYRKHQIQSLLLIKQLLHIERYSIEGAKKKLTELRKTAKLKEAIQQVGQLNAAPPLGVGSVLPKDQIQSLQQKLEDLETLIREPKVAGVVVPGLKTV